MSTIRFSGSHLGFIGFLTFFCFGVAPDKPLGGGGGSPKPVALRPCGDSPCSSSV